MNDNINQLNENFETYQEILKDDMDYQNNNITSSNEQIKCYCGHTDYCDCGPLEDEVESGQDDFYQGFIEGTKWQAERMYSEEDIRKAILASFLLGVDRGDYSKELEDKLIEKYKKK